MTNGKGRIVVHSDHTEMKVWVERNDRRLFVGGITGVWALSGLALMGPVLGFATGVVGFFFSLFVWEAVLLTYPKGKPGYPGSLEPDVVVQFEHTPLFFIPSDLVGEDTAPRKLFAKAEEYAFGGLDELDDYQAHRAAVTGTMKALGCSMDEAEQRLNGATGSTAQRIQYALMNIRS